MFQGVQVDDCICVDVLKVYWCLGCTCRRVYLCTCAKGVLVFQSVRVDECICVDVLKVY